MASINASTAGAGGVITTADASGVLELQTASTTRMTITAAGNVGIGTSSPTGRFTSFNSAATSTSQYANILGWFSANAANADCSIGLSNGVDSSSRIGIVGGANIYFAQNGVERMRIDTSGNVLVGTTSSGSGVGNTNSGVGVEGAGTVTVSRGDNIAMYVNTNADRTLISCRRSGNEVGRISVTSTATAYNTSSDYRLKENIAPMTGALETVAQLKPVTYTWKVNGYDGQGFIAHELQEVVPDCVTGEKDAADENGNPFYQGIDTSFLVATLTAAIQEQQALITSLTERIAVLENK